MSPSPLHVRTPHDRIERAARSAWHGARAVGFWTAVLLPAAYPAVLFAGAWLPEPRTLLIGLIGVHLLALAVGRDYGRRTPEG